MAERIGVYPGTFDPVTNGHMDIIRRALSITDRLVIAVALDTAKRPMFSLEERSQIVQQELASLGAEAHRVEVRAFSGLLVNFVAEIGASMIVRGLRAVSDFEYEFQMACMNNKLKPEIETVFLTASESTHFISSRFVKEIARLGGDVSEVVSPNVSNHLKRYFASNPAN